MRFDIKSIFILIAIYLIFMFMPVLLPVLLLLFIGIRIYMAYKYKKQYKQNNDINSSYSNDTNVIDVEYTIKEEE